MASVFAMTEPAVANSDVTNIELQMDRDGDTLVLTGRKWFAANALHATCRVLIVMDKTDDEAALELMCGRALSRVTFGATLSERGNIQDWIAEARIRIEMIRLPTLKTAHLMDTVGKQAAHVEIAAIKVAAPRIAGELIDRAIQVYGGAGVTDDRPLAAMCAHVRTLRIADGPDEVHERAIARRELLSRAHARSERVGQSA